MERLLEYEVDWMNRLARCCGCCPIDFELFATSFLLEADFGYIVPVTGSMHRKRVKVSTPAFETKLHR
jgi:hypothetical protein